jgi:hypothetical protein
MNTATLIQLLQHPEAHLRLNAARILGMVDEVEALPALAKAFQCETDPAARKVMAWAGKRLKEAHAGNYNTFAQLWKHYQIEREVQGGKSPDADVYLGLDAHQLEMIRQQIEAESRSRKIQQRTMGTTLSPLSGGKAGGTGELRSTHTHDIGDSRRRAMPTQPTQTDTRVHVQRLLRDPQPEMRRKAAMTLGDINNPAALPALAQAFMEDASPDVQAAAQQVGKLLYWNLLYWEMERDGIIQYEIERRKAQNAASNAPSAGETPSAKSTQERAIEDLLRRGREKRRKP